MKQEEASLQQELESVQLLLSHYNMLKQQNEDLTKAIQEEKEHILHLKEEKQRTLDNMLNEEEYWLYSDVICRAQELEKQRKVLDASERMEAELMIEVGGRELLMNVDWQAVEDDGLVHVHLSFNNGAWGNMSGL